MKANVNKGLWIQSEAIMAAGIPMIRGSILAACIGFLVLGPCPAGAQPGPSQEGLQEAGLPPGISDSWVATDALGRKLASWEEAGSARPGKYVAMFYWTWHTMAGVDVEPVNVQSIISRYPEAMNDYTHPQWTRGGRHHWSEPLFGYYVSTDRWILRKHAEMLADAGVDVVFFDCTNATFMWDDALHALGEVWTQARRDGIRAPSMVFMCPFWPGDNSPVLITKIYEQVYKKGLYRDLWFYWEGKPVIMGYPDRLDEEVREFFTFRPGQPDYLKGPSRPDHWGWLEMYPKHGYVEYAPGKFEQVTVGVAQNATDSLTPAAMNDTNMVYGRSYTRQHGMDARPEAVNYGLNFQEQWERAFEIDPKMVFVTGWNEWTAGRYKVWQGTPNALPDQCCQEYSRDIEPMKGGHGDNYYYQLVNNVRKFKGVRPPPRPSGPRTVVIDGSFGEWEEVLPEYLDHRDMKEPRDHRGYGSTHYTNHTLRNDILRARVCRDDENLYFYVETASAISPPAAKWMMLLIDVDRDRKTGWEGYDYVVNRKAPGEQAILEKCTGRWKWIAWGRIDYRVSGNKMELAIPKRLLGAGRAINSIAFKWSDNMQQEGDIMDFYSNGDAAPGGRFNYLYTAF
jgi:hypothetical protein